MARTARLLKNSNIHTKESVMQSVEKIKREWLIKQGWKEISPEFDMEYFQELGFEKVGKELGYYFSAFGEEMKKSFLGFLSKDLDEARSEMVSNLCPNVQVPPAPQNTPMISAQWPLGDGYSTSERAFEELTYRTIVLTVFKVLGPPREVYQYTDNFVFSHPHPDRYDFESEMISELVAIWDNAYLKIEPTTQWTDNGSTNAQDWTLYSKELRKLSTHALKGTGLEINPKSYQLGRLDPEFKLDSFPQYIQVMQNELQKEMFFQGKSDLGAGYTGVPERHNTIIVGPPGYGKTRFSQAFAAEVLSPQGYLVMVVDYSSLQDLVIPSYLDQVCIIVNDADTLALNRDESKRGETEQVLSWLDGTRSTYIKPFYLDKRASIITIMTANSIERWDAAALRQGRIHTHLVFDQINLSIGDTDESDSNNEWPGDRLA